MLSDLDRTLRDFEQGKIDRRSALMRLAGLLVAVAGIPSLPAKEEAAEATFVAEGLNHLALQVTDVARSRDFYVQHLGLRVLRDDGSRCFLGCGEYNFVALFRGDPPGLDHYCYTVEDYDPGPVVEKLKANGFSPIRRDNRVYFEDPDGLTVQLAAKWSAWPGPRPR